MVGDTLLMQATRTGHLDVVKVLVDSKANIDIQNQSGAPALREAKGRRELVNVLAKAATPNSLVWAVNYGKEHGGEKFIVQALLDAKMDVNAHSTTKLGHLEAGSTALIAATGQRDLTEFLLNKDADPNLKDRSKTPPLVYAAKSGKKDCVSLLLEKKANVDDCDPLGNTPAIAAVSTGGSTWDPSLLKLLIVAKANVNKTNLRNEAPLHFARRRDIAQLLLDSGAELIVYNKVGDTAVEKAIEGKAPEVAELLRENIGIAKISVADQMRFIIRAKEIDPSPSKELKNLLGEGGAGKVYQAEWAGTQVAVKKLKTLTVQSRRELIQEALFMQTISHPNIVRLYGICVEPNNECIVMELCEAGSFYGYLTDYDQKITWQAGLRKLMYACAAMLFLHTREPPVIHRDLKALNILLQANGSALLSDLGLATANPTNPEDPEEVAGSYPWMAPELHDGKSASRASDVYAFGMILYEVRARMFPFWDLTDDEFKNIGELVKSGRRPQVDKDSDIPPGYDELMEKCWSKNQDERPLFPEIYAILQEMFEFVKQNTPDSTIKGAAIIPELTGASVTPTASSALTTVTPGGGGLALSSASALTTVTPAPKKAIPAAATTVMKRAALTVRGVLPKSLITVVPSSGGHSLLPPTPAPKTGPTLAPPSSRLTTISPQ
eukprot:TRINITY_DN12777_c0_g1_i3.p1 TRINITY_DN12777_c0_g1~~TRINITY_DN12777_c0_g1_i3.p1  ORF type:complete len:764 (+),score=137.02 TRINITY_DN12777_c0_g1_i3:297-2294(+)